MSTRKIVNAWYIVCIIGAALTALVLMSWGIKAIWFAPDTEFVNCQDYHYVDGLVICQERPVESPVTR